VTLGAHLQLDLAAHGLVVVRAFAGGEFGAHLVHDKDGCEWVLKSSTRDDVISRLDFAAAATEVLGSRGSPVPAYGIRGQVGDRHWWLQEVLHGDVARPCSSGVVAQLVGLTAEHRDGALKVARLVDGDLPTSRPSPESIDSALSLIRHVDPVIDDLRRAAGDVQDVRLRTTDIVHGDLHPLNVMSVGDVVTGVFDWDFAHAGDWRRDLVVLAFWSNALVSVDGPGMAAAAGVAASALHEHVPDDVRALLTLALLAFEFVFTVEAHPERIPWMAARACEVQAWWR
jgi:hypothetical protein